MLSSSLYKVATPYVNHIATMTGGMGFKDLARFYKVRQRHFESEQLLIMSIVSLYEGKRMSCGARDRYSLTLG